MKRVLLIYYLLFLSAFIFLLKAQTGTLPDTVILNYVSVIDSGDVKINWTYFVEKDTIDGFVLNYKKHLGTGLESNEPFGIASHDSTNYIDTSGKANQSSVPYSVYSFVYEIDSTIRRVSLSSTHHTIFLKSEWQKCFDTINLHWNKYIGWGDDIISYRVYENNSLLSPSTFDTVYSVHVNINSDYQYFVEAHNTKHPGFVSRSNIISQRTPFLEPPDYINANYATVDGEAIFLSFTIGPNGRSGYKYILVAKPSSESTFSLVLDTIDIDDSDTIGYEFFNSDITEQYKFKIIAEDSCGNSRAESNISSNIVLQGDKDGNGNTVNLNWTPYFEWPGGVESYKLYRDVDNGSPEEVFGISGFEFNDNIQSFIDDEQITSIRYYIEAKAVGTDFYSRSNIVVIYLEDRLEFPTAFTPNGDGMNDIFRPIKLYFIPTDYHLIVYDRWGKKVFETTQVEQGWDGKFRSGKNVLEGVYHYYVKYKNPEGTEISQTGIVTVIYP